RAQGQRLVQVVRGDDVDRLDLRVVGDAVEVVVAVDVAVGDAVLGLPLRDLRGRAGDDAGEVAVAGQLQAGGEQVAGVVAQADQGHADRIRTSCAGCVAALAGGGAGTSPGSGGQGGTDAGAGHGGQQVAAGQSGVEHGASYICVCGARSRVGGGRHTMPQHA